MGRPLAAIIAICRSSEGPWSRSQGQYAGRQSKHSSKTVAASTCAFGSSQYVVLGSYFSYTSLLVLVSPCLSSRTIGACVPTTHHSAWPPLPLFVSLHHQVLENRRCQGAVPRRAPLALPLAGAYFAPCYAALNCF